MVGTYFDYIICKLWDIIYPAVGLFINCAVWQAFQQVLDKLVKVFTRARCFKFNEIVL